MLWELNRFTFMGLFGQITKAFQGKLGPRTKSEMSLSGRIFVSSKRNNIVVSVWKDKKPVYFLSTQGDEKDTRKQWDGTNIEEPSVPVMNSYNTNMSGMDLSDQISGLLLIWCAPTRWEFILRHHISVSKRRRVGAGFTR